MRTAPRRTGGVVDEYLDVFRFGICQAIRLGVRWQAANACGDCRGHANLLHAFRLAPVRFGLQYNIANHLTLNDTYILNVSIPGKTQQYQGVMKWLQLSSDGFRQRRHVGPMVAVHSAQ
jgi:hypothetical protein